MLMLGGSPRPSDWLGRDASAGRRTGRNAIVVVGVAGLVSRKGGSRVADAGLNQRDAAGVLAARRSVRRRRRRAVSQSVTGRPCCDDETPAERAPRRTAVAITRAARSPCGRRPPFACWCSSAFTWCSWPSERLCSLPSRRRRKRPGSGNSRSSGKVFSTGTRVSKVY